MQDVAIIAGAGALAGAMNAVAGGGSFVTLPALIFAGVPSVAANASSTVALFPGAASSTYAYRRELHGVGGVGLGVMAAASVAGGLAGAVLLLATPSKDFDAILPWLLLLATLAFFFGPRVGARLGARGRAGPGLVLAVQFVLSVYGGYFGGAVGIMLMAVWTLLGVADIKTMNPAKVLLVGAANSIAVACFVIAGIVWWRQTIVMLLPATLCAYIAARIGRRLPVAVLRAFVTVLTVTMTIAFFIRAYGIPSR